MTSGASTSSLKNVRSAPRHAADEALERLAVAGLQHPDVHQHPLVAVGGDPAGETRQGVPERGAPGPERDTPRVGTARPGGPAGRPASRQARPPPRHHGVLLGHRVEHVRPGRREVDLAAADAQRAVHQRVARTNSSTTSRNAAPGNGTWSRVHCAIAWKPRTNSSFQRFSSSVARWATIVVGRA